ncbi:helix-turn-helix transcriptional regulator [Beijerinckia sp. L45]|uniref:helix-turn-helix domain-containing protein n=1 Tax=Beijerinckia sp. L45 TaxID=1641855 RepID=UPI00131AD217|nr:helix-turn-helix transcriptional regulator [Beijerinckia sp. L45]
MTLAEYFAETGIKDEAFADKVKISRSMITRLRLRTATPSAGAAMRIFDATNGNVTLAELMPLPHEPARADA